MSVLENPEVLKQQTIPNKNISIPLKIYKIDYVTYPNKKYERKTAFILAETPEAAEQLIIHSVDRGVEIQWESRAGQVCEIHGVTETLQNALYAYLNRKYEGPSIIEKAKKLRGK